MSAYDKADLRLTTVRYARRYFEADVSLINPLNFKGQFAIWLLWYFKQRLH